MQKKCNKLILFPSHVNHTCLYEVALDFFKDIFSEIHVYAYPDVAEALDIAKENHTIKVIIRQRGDNDLKLLQKINKETDYQDAILFDEPFGSVKALIAAFLLIRFKARRYMFIHDTNKWFVLSFVELWRRLRDLILRRYIVKQMSGLMVINEKVKEYVEHFCLYEKPVFVFPFASLRESANLKPQNPGDVVVFAVPGSLNAEKRDYGPVIDVFEELWDEGHLNMVLKLVGNVNQDPQSLAMGERIKAVNKRLGAIKIVYHDSHLPLDVFEEEIAAADVLINNVQFFSRNNRDSNVEIYGQSRESGATHFILKYAKPTIIPEYMRILPEIRCLIMSYFGREDLKKIVLDIILGKTDIQQMQNEFLGREADVRKRYLEHMSRFVEYHRMLTTDA